MSLAPASSCMMRPDVTMGEIPSSINVPKCLIYYYITSGNSTKTYTETILLDFSGAQKSIQEIDSASLRSLAGRYDNLFLVGS